MTARLLLAAALAAPRLVAPGPAATVAEGTVRLYAEVQPGRALTVTVDGKPAGACRGEKQLAHCEVALPPGTHAVAVSDGTGAAQWRLTRADERARLPLDAELGYQTSFHRPDAEKACAGCHAMAQGDGQPKDTSMLGGACVGCHAALLRYKVQHGPVGQGMCLECHDPAGAPRYAVKWPAQETCFRCHADVQGAMEKKRYRHGPAAQGRCTTCHDPHGSDNPFWLRRAPFDVCTNCHTEKRDERHVVVGFVYGDSHPKKGRVHPRKPRAEFACPGCHNPHTGQSRFVWQFDSTSREVLCRTCHRK